MIRKFLITLAGLAAVVGGIVGLAPSALATTATIPGAPSGLVAAPGNATVTLSWTAPTSNGGSAITGYNVYEGTKSGGEDYAHPVNGGTLVTATTFVVTGLSNAQSYYFTVKAVNAVGSSAASNEAWATPAATVPGAPRNVTATAADVSATVTWSAPTSPGGSNITSYTVKAADATAPSRGGQSCTWTSGPLSCTVTGLTNGDSYTFTVTATNSLGTGTASSPSKAVVPAVTAPSAPTALTATPGNTTVTLSWTAPASGGSAITGYDVYESTSSGAENYSKPVNTASISGTTTTVTGLANGTEYYFTVKAINSVGSSSPSAEVWAIPAGTAPGAPTAAHAVAGYASATVTWSAPSDLGGAAISRYTVTATDTTLASRGGQSCTWTTGPLSCTVTGLTNGDLYTFSVTATNSVGTSVASSASNAVIPAITAPLAPTTLTATPGNHNVVLTWTAPANGGASIVGYNVYEATSAGAENYASPVNGAVLVSGTTATISGLTNGDTYYFTVKAVNAVGSSPASNEAWATPAATTADSPQDVGVTVGPNGSAVVNWTAPLDSGGSSITGYVVTPYIGATAQAARVFDNNTATTETITGLTPGVSYTFTVAAINASGTGAQSAPSTAVAFPRAATSLALAMSAATVTFGHEQAEKFSVVLSPAWGPVPAGTVLVKKSTTTLCTITLSAGKGSCSLSASELPARTFSVYATYARNTNFYGAVALKKSLTVAKASTKTTLKLSTTKVTFGHEQLERLTVTVSPQYPGMMPSGPVTITGFACDMTLSSGKGSCTLSSKKFPVGTEKLVAHYWGGGSFNASLSASTTLTVVK